VEDGARKIIKKLEALGFLQKENGERILHEKVITKSHLET
jgi:ribosomal protein S19E (S16A)